MKLKYDKLPPNFAFKCKLRHYVKNFDAVSVLAFLGTFTSTLVVGFVMYVSGVWGVSYPFSLKAGRCSLTPG